MRKILILAANPIDSVRLQLDQEVRDIREGLERARNREAFAITQRWAVRPRDIQRSVQDELPQIVHFSGHGKGEEGLYFESPSGGSQLVAGKALASLFKLFVQKASIECVVLNGCYSKVQAEAIVEQVPYVIGMQNSVNDQAAIEFSVGFYSSLGNGDSVEFAFESGKVAMELSGIGHSEMPILLKRYSDAVSNKDDEETTTHSTITAETHGDSDSLDDYLSLVTVGQINPFECGNPVPPDRFYGRHNAIRDVKDRIGSISSQSINIVGLRRSGKTSLIRYIQERQQEFFTPHQKPIVVTINFHNRQYQTYEGIYEGLRRGIKKAIGKEPWHKDFNDNPFETQDGLSDIRDEGYRLIVVFDEFETVAKRSDFLHSWDEDWRAISNTGALSTIIASKSPLSHIYSEARLTSSFHNIFTTTTLGALEESEWQQLVGDGFESSQKADIDSIYKYIDDLAGGLPYYVQLAASLLWKHQDTKLATEEFIFQSYPIFEELWSTLSNKEKEALFFYAGSNEGAMPTQRLMMSLQRYGLIRSNQSLFSTAFSDFMKDKK